MDYLFGVNFQSQGKLQYFLVNYQINKGDLVICESLKGIELGRVATNPKEYIVKEVVANFREDANVIDIEKKDSGIYVYFAHDKAPVTGVSDKMENAMLKIVQLESNKLNLNMKLLSAEYTLDQSKLTVSYLADDRVDFRELLKVLASLYHCRIELRQIGPRDKAKMVGGIGICGLPLCCSTFLNEFDGISITMAKNQMLALNIPKLSGHCGKLICCLKYEDDVYSLEKTNLPKVGMRVNYQDQLYRISAINILTKMIKLENTENVVTVPLSEIEKNIVENYNPTQPMRRNAQQPKTKIEETNETFSENTQNTEIKKKPFKKNFYKNKGQKHETN